MVLVYHRVVFIYLIVLAPRQTYDLRVDMVLGFAQVRLFFIGITCKAIFLCAFYVVREGQYLCVI